MAKKRKAKKLPARKKSTASKRRTKKRSRKPAQLGFWASFVAAFGPPSGRGS
jgi:hypothetical protein